MVSFDVGGRTLTAIHQRPAPGGAHRDARGQPSSGDMPVEAIFSDYKDYAGVKFPTRIVQRQGGHPTLDVTVADVRPNGAATMAVARAEPAPAPPSPVTTELEKIADGVCFLTGGAPMERARRVQRPRGDHRGTSGRCEVGGDDRGGQSGDAGQADSLRGQHASSLRPLGRPSRLCRRGHSDHHAREEQAVLRADLPQPVHARSPIA